MTHLIENTMSVSFLIDTLRGGRFRANPTPIAATIAVDSPLKTVPPEGIMLSRYTEA